MINYMGSSFFMQPLAAHLAKQHGSSGGSRPHLIYRRSLGDVKNECQLSGEIIYLHNSFSALHKEVNLHYKGNLNKLRMQPINIRDKSGTPLTKIYVITMQLSVRIY